MFGDFIKAGEVLAKLLKLYVDVDRKIFTDHIDPTFSDMSKIHTDYLGVAALSEDLINDLDDGKTKDVLKGLRTKRINFEATRAKIRAEARAVIGSDSRKWPPEAVAFYEACLGYFTSESEYTDGRRFTGLYCHAERYRSPSMDDQDHEYLRFVIGTWGDIVRERWPAVTDAYAAAKLALCR